MRIWSVHPKYLDSKGLVALWRETLLAKNVLMGKTKGYKNHPQLKRFKETKNSIQAINQYLSSVYEESVSRGYSFNREKIDWDFSNTIITVTNLQVQYERNHLLMKLEIRDQDFYNKWKNIQSFETHPLFKMVDGKIEDWEIVNSH